MAPNSKLTGEESSTRRAEIKGFAFYGIRLDR